MAQKAALAAQDAARNAPPQNAGGNVSPTNAAGNTPPQNAAEDPPPSQNAAGNVSPTNAAEDAPPSQNAAENLSSSTNIAGNASSKKRKVMGDDEAEVKSKDDPLPDLNQEAEGNNPIPGDEDEENNGPSATVSFCSYGRRYGRR